jgi:hypothetical protein
MARARSASTEVSVVTHWSIRLLADQLGISDSTVARVWAEHDVKPWQTDTFRFSSDPELEARVRDVIGLCLEPRVTPPRWTDVRMMVALLAPYATQGGGDWRVALA